MGLLDALSGAGDPGGGLLAFLQSLGRSSQQPPAQMGPLPSDQAQYGSGTGVQAPVFAQSPAVTAQANPQPGSMDSARWPAGPIGAPSQANAQFVPPPVPQQPPAVIPAQPMPTQPAPQPTPGIGDHIMAGLGGLTHGNSPLGALISGAHSLVTGQREDDQAVAQRQVGQVLNQTARALQLKGVDPVVTQAALAQYAAGDKTALETLWNNAFKKPTYSVAGSGNILNSDTGKVSKEFEPEDKTPAGFATDDKGMHFVPGGPADPAYLRLAEAQKKDPTGNYVLGRGGAVIRNNPDGTVTEVYKNTAETPDATLDDKTTGAMAAQYLAGDKSVMQNLGRGAQGAANIVKLRTEIYKQANDQGLDGKAIVNNFNEQAGNLAGQRSIGTRSANISLAANEASNMIPIALEASAKVPRGEWMPWNKMVQAYQTGSSSPELARFVAATNSLVNSYVRAVSPSGVPTDSMREHAYSMLNSAQSPQAYQAVTSIMQDEMKAAMAAPGQVRKELRHEETPAAGPKDAPKPGAYVWSPDGGIVPK